MLRLGHRAYCVAMQRELVGHNFTLSEWRHLRTLYDEDGLTPVEISQRIGIERASSTAVLQSLERRQLIRRVRSRKDRRNLHVFLTPTGEKLRGTLLPCAVAVNGAARNGLSNDDVFTFFRLIRTMIANLERPAGRRGPMD
ncbi:MAG TPA: MarR family winged helix-turn-helix transcriptional regulator [Alphaproteobacteria bacterium]